MISLIILGCCFFVAIRSFLMDLSKNLKDIYSKWEQKGRERMQQLRPSPPAEHHHHNHHVNRQAPVTANNRLWLNRGHSRLKNKIPELQQNVASFKTQPLVMPDNVLLRPFTGNCCSKCLPLSRLAFHDEITQTLGIKDILRFPMDNRNQSFLARTFHFFAYFFQRRPRHKYIDIASNVLSNPRVEEAIKKTISQEIKDPTDVEAVQQTSLKLRHRALRILEVMRSTISGTMLKIAAWVFCKMLRRILKAINTHNGQLEALKKASRSNIPIIYLPLHRSHLDYILVTLVLYLHDLRGPLVAAGNNLMIPLFGNILRGLGAFFIKRKLDFSNGHRDHLYRAILHTYMEESLNAGHHLEFFIEGGRSRTGKSCLPKGGLLSVVVDTMREKNVEDVYIVPVAINYEKIIDGNFVSEQLGKKKVSESFFLAVRSIWNTLHSQFGSVRIDFCQPFSLREMIQSSKTFHPPTVHTSIPASPHSPASVLRSSHSTGSLSGNEDTRKTIKDIAEHIVYDATKATSLMTTNLLAFLLLTKYRKGAPLHHLAQSVSWLREEVYIRGRDVGFSGESADAVRHAATLLGPDLVSVENVHMEWVRGTAGDSSLSMVFLKPAVHLPHVLELQYYSNPVVTVFLQDAVLAMAIFALLGEEELDVWRDSTQKEVTILREQLLDKALRLCDILQYEFIFAPPCTDLSVQLGEAITNLIDRDILLLEKEEAKDERGWATRATFKWDDDEDDEEAEPKFVDQKLKINLEDDVVDQLYLFRSVLGSIVESYWLVASSLHKLVNCEKDEKVFFREIQQTAQDRLHEGVLLFEESFAADTLRNALKLFEHWKVLEGHQTECGLRVLYLNELHNSTQAVQELVARVEQYKL